MVNKQKILIVDDDEAIAELVSLYLAKECFDTMMVHDGEKALVAFDTYHPNLVLLDLMLPGIDGYQVCREIRKKSQCPIIMLTAKGEVFDKVLGLELGADDYVVKPFSPKEIMARINAVMKRRTKVDPTNSRETIKFEGLEIDMVGRNVYVDGQKAVLTPKEYELLFYMVKNSGIALSREKLLSDVWGYDFYGDDRTVDTHIKMLRSNLKEYRKFIITLRGMGYKFEA